MAKKNETQTAKIEIKPIPGNKPASGGRKPPAVIGREMKTDPKPETVKVEEKLPTKEEEERKKALDEVDSAMKKLSMYPVSANEQARGEALETLKKMYARQSPNVKQVMLYVLHERIAKFGELRIPKNFEYFRKKLPQAEPVQLRMNVYNEMFNYTNSLEGMLEIINLLAELGDDDAAKVLTHQFSFFSSADGSEGARMLRNATVEALGKSNSLYALRALLSYADSVDGEQLGGRILSAIAGWKEKLGKMKVEQKQKDALMARIGELVLLEREEGHYR
ncbi:MAG: hypothetical protein PHS02_03020 [Candidatus ainarchaeum sp.]|nr:hypothetical protein [Candidatus ainarchaeum sp.]